MYFCVCSLEFYSCTSKKNVKLGVQRVEVLDFDTVQFGLGPLQPLWMVINHFHLKPMAHFPDQYDKMETYRTTLSDL